jgi:hypothetical protein
LFLAFLTPKFDPSLEQELADQESEEGTSGGLPTKQDDEFRPFIRRYGPSMGMLAHFKVTRIQVLALSNTRHYDRLRVYLVFLL